MSDNTTIPILLDGDTGIIILCDKLLKNKDFILKLIQLLCPIEKKFLISLIL